LCARAAVTSIAYLPYVIGVPQTTAVCCSAIVVVMASARDEETVTGDYVATFSSFEDAMRDVKEYEDRTNFRFVITKTRKRGI